MKCDQHTGGLGVIVACGLSRAIKLIVELCALGEIGVALAQSRAHTWLRLGRDTNSPFQRNGGPERKWGKRK